MGANVMYLKEGTKDHFMGFLAREFPQMVEGYDRLYAGAYARRPSTSQAVRGLIDALQQRYDLSPPRTQSDVRARGDRRRPRDRMDAWSRSHLARRT